MHTNESGNGQLTRAEADERLREYELVVEALQEMIVVIDREYRYRIANRAYLAFRGLQKHELVGKSLKETLNRTLFETTVKPKLETAFGGSVVKYEYQDCWSGQHDTDFFITYIPMESAGAINQVAIILEDVTERKKAEDALRTLSGRLLRLEDEERCRLARELHDTTAQCLAALSMNLAVVGESAGLLPPRAQASLAESTDLAAQCLREVRTVAYLLHPRELRDSSLQPALSRYIQGFAQRSGIQVEMEAPADLGPAPKEVEAAAFRLVQECLTNVHRHSGSATARVRIGRTPSRLTVEVRDAGRGFDPNAAAGVGIASMRERIRQLHGSLEIESAAPGATVRASIPLHGAP